MIGRKLNTRLAELKMHSKETMSKQQLRRQLAEALREAIDASRDAG